jgi:hypothetical protein
LTGKCEGKRIYLNGSYRNSIGQCGLDYCGSEQGQVACSCEQGNEPLGSIKCRKLLDQLKTISFSSRNLLHGVSYIITKYTRIYLHVSYLKIHRLKYTKL